MSASTPLDAFLASAPSVPSAGTISLGLTVNLPDGTQLALSHTLDASQLRQLREEIGVHGRSGATQLPQIVVVRHLGCSSQAARAVMVAAWRRLRPVPMQREAVIPRLWNT